MTAWTAWRSPAAKSLTADSRARAHGGAVGALYHKLRVRDSIDYPLAGVAVAMKIDSAGMCRDARVALPAVNPAPVLLRRRRNSLVGKKWSEELADRVAHVAIRTGKPLTTSAFDARLPPRHGERLHAARARRDLCARKNRCPPFLIRCANLKRSIFRPEDAPPGEPELMPVIDIHIHIQPLQMFKPHARELMHKRRGLRRGSEIHVRPAEFLKFLDAAEIERAGLINYVSPDVIGFTPEVNDWIARYCSADPKRLLAFGSVHPKYVRDAASGSRSPEEDRHSRTEGASFTPTLRAQRVSQRLRSAASDVRASSVGRASRHDSHGHLDFRGRSECLRAAHPCRRRGRSISRTWW